MKLDGVFFTVLVAFHVAVGGVYSASVSLSGSQLKVSGDARVEFNVAVEDVWAGLSNGHRYPVIESGDLIALRLAYTSGDLASSWLSCNTSYCTNDTCGGTSMNSTKWSTCSSNMMFKINAKGKMDGQPINSGDTVTLGSKASSYSYRLRCQQSSNKCATDWSHSLIIKGNHWLSCSYVTFQIYSKNAVDGTPVQFGDVVGFKYPTASNTAWLYYSNPYFYARSCNALYKSYCAKENYPAGFLIFKQL